MILNLYNIYLLICSLHSAYLAYSFIKWFLGSFYSYSLWTLSFFYNPYTVRQLEDIKKVS